MTSFNFRTAVYNILKNLNKPSLSLTDLDNLPAPYNVQIKNEITRQLCDVRDAIISLPLWENSNANFEKFIENFFQNLGQYVCINQKVLENLLLFAIKLRYNYLSKPISTLLLFTFESSKTKPKSEVFHILNLFIDYGKILRELHHQLEVLPEHQVSVYTFYYLLKNSWYRTLNQSTSPELVDFFNPIFELYKDESNEITIAPTSFFIDLFEDIGLKNLSMAFKKVLSKKENLTKEEFSETLINILEVYKNHIETALVDAKDTNTNRIINFTDIEPFAFQIPENIQKLDKDIFLKSVSKETLVSAKREEISDIKELLTKFDSSYLESKQTTEETTNENETQQKITQQEVDEDGKENLTEVSQEILPNRNYPEEQENFVELSLQEEIHSNYISNETTTETNYDKFSSVSEVHLEQIAVPEELSASLAHQPEQIQNEKEVDDQHLDDFTSNSFPYLSHIIDETKRRQFIDELFYSMEEEYNLLVHKVDESQNFEEALQHVYKFYNDFGIFTEMPIAKEFIEFVKKKFSNQRE